MSDSESNPEKVGSKKKQSQMERNEKVLLTSTVVLVVLLGVVVNILLSPTMFNGNGLNWLLAFGLSIRWIFSLVLGYLVIKFVHKRIRRQRELAERTPNESGN